MKKRGQYTEKLDLEELLSQARIRMGFLSVERACGRRLVNAPTSSSVMTSCGVL